MLTMQLKTYDDMKKLGNILDDYIKKIDKLEYGFYSVTIEQTFIFSILENMLYLQKKLNKGIRKQHFNNDMQILGYSIKENIIEIYDIDEVKQDLRSTKQEDKFYELKRNIRIGSRF